jgi:hypothetical protein
MSSAKRGGPDDRGRGALAAGDALADSVLTAGDTVLATATPAVAVADGSSTEDGGFPLGSAGASVSPRRLTAHVPAPTTSAIPATTHAAGRVLTPR